MSTGSSQPSPWEIPGVDVPVPGQRIVEFFIKLKRTPSALHDVADAIRKHDVNIHKGTHFLTPDRRHIVWVFFADVSRETDVHYLASTILALDCVEEASVEDGCVEAFLFPPVLEGSRWLLLDGAALGKISEAVREILGESGRATVLYNAGYAAGWEFTGSIEVLLNPRSIADWLSLLERLFPALGWGRPKFEEMNLSRASGVVVCTNLLETEPYLKRRSSNKICHLFRGYLAGVLSRIAERPMMVSEVCCQAVGDDNCIFEVKPAARHPVILVTDR